MEHGSRGIQRQIVIRNDARRAPLGSVKVDLQHMVGHVFSKAQLFVGHLGLRVRRALNRDCWLLRINGIVQSDSSGEGAHKGRVLWG